MIVDSGGFHLKRSAVQDKRYLTPIDIRASNNSSHPILLAYVLLVLSLMNASTGTVGQRFLTASSRHNAAATGATAYKASFYSDPQRCGSSVSKFAQSAIGSSSWTRTEAQCDKIRRIAALALVLYATGDRIRR